MLNKFRNFLYRFMYGRNGADELSRFLLYFSFVGLIPATFTSGYLRLFFLGLFWFIVLFNYYRMFSKKLYKRQKENAWYVNKRKYLIQRFKDRKNYRYFNCPKCKTHLRVPKGVGKVEITCKKCGHKFDRKA